MIYIQGEVGTTQVELAMQYNTGYSETVYTFANNINTQEGGTHLSGFRSALTRTLNDYARKNNMLKNNEESFDRRRRARGPHCRAQRPPDRSPV